MSDETEVHVTVNHDTGETRIVRQGESGASELTIDIKTGEPIRLRGHITVNLESLPDDIYRAD